MVPRLGLVFSNPDFDRFCFGGFTLGSEKKKTLKNDFELGDSEGICISISLGPPQEGIHLKLQQPEVEAVEVDRAYLWLGAISLGGGELQMPGLGPRVHRTNVRRSLVHTSTSSITHKERLRYLKHWSWVLNVSRLARSYHTRTPHVLQAVRQAD